MVRGRGFVPALRAVPAQSGVLRPAGSGTNLTLTHTGFYNEQSVARHEDARPAVLAHLDEQMTTTHASRLTRRWRGAHSLRSSPRYGPPRSVRLARRHNLAHDPEVVAGRPLALDANRHRGSEHPERHRTRTQRAARLGSSAQPRGSCIGRQPAPGARHRSRTRGEPSASARRAHRAHRWLGS